MITKLKCFRVFLRLGAKLIISYKINRNILEGLRQRSHEGPTCNIYWRGGRFLGGLGRDGVASSFQQPKTFLKPLVNLCTLRPAVFEILWTRRIHAHTKHTNNLLLTSEQDLKTYNNKNKNDKYNMHKSEAEEIRWKRE